MSHRDRLDGYLKQIEKRLRLGVLLKGAAILTSAALIATVVLVLVTNIFAFSQGSISGARVVLFFALAVALALGVALPLYALNRRRAAGRAEAAFPQFQQRLMTFVDRDAGGREPFMELLAADTLELARGTESARLAPKGKLLLLLAAGIACVGVLIWTITSGPGYLGYGARRLWAVSSHSTPAFYDIRVHPGDAAVRRNASQMITAQLVGFASPQARLYARYHSASKWEEGAMQPGTSGFQFLLAGIPEDVEYYVESGRVRSRHFNIRVVDLPSIKQIRVTYHYPAWTGLPDAVEERGGDLRAVEGTAAKLAILTDRPLRGGVLVLGSGQKIALSGGDGNLYQGAIRVEKDGRYHVAALDQGQLVRLSDDFFIEAQKANPPEVSITRPGGDYHASPLEEVAVSVKATDDYGLKGVSLHYSVNGGPEQAVNMLKRRGAKEADGSTILYLENFKMVPGDVVSLYAKAKDGNSESHSDMFFIQVEPFEREYSQSQLAGGGGMGGQQFEISRREKEIIAATWKQQSNKQATRQEAAGRGKFLSGVQDKLRNQALSLAGRLQMRELNEENEAFSSFQRDMAAAAGAMGPASGKLRQQKWNAAISSEEKALQQLLRAEATFRRIQVAFGSQSSGGGAGTGRDLADLYNLELNTEKNQYETAQTAASASQRAQQIDKAFQKLDELARREQALANQQHSSNNQNFQQRWQQEMLRREAEQLQKQLEQLAQSNGQGQHGSSASGSQGSNAGSQGTAGERIQRALDQLRQANEALRRAASQGQNAADARRAADRLAQASRLLSGIQRQQTSGQLDSLARQADRLTGEERDQAARIRQMFGNKANSLGEAWSNARDQKQSKLADDRELLATDLSRLEEGMQDAARKLESTQGDTASKLRRSLAGVDQADLGSRLGRSAEAIRMGIDPDSKTMEPAIAAGIKRLNEGVHEAQQSLKSDRTNPTEEALDRVERLRNEIEALTRNLGNPRARNGQTGEQSRGSQEAQGNQQAQGGRGSQGGNVNGGFESGAPGGPRTWRGGRVPSGGAYIEPPGSGQEPDSSASDELAFRRALQELGGLRRELRSEPESLADIQQLMRDLQRLGPGSFQANPALVQQLRTRVLTSVDNLELQLRRKLEDQQSGQVRNGDFLRVPPGYQESVADYFRRLSKNQKAVGKTQ